LLNDAVVKVHAVKVVGNGSWLLRKTADSQGDADAESQSM
jgi:hypothetical protein